MLKWFTLVSIAFLINNYRIDALRVARSRRNDRTRSRDDYRPVFLIHGFMRNEQSMNTIAQEIKRAHPGTTVYTTEKYNGYSSTEDIWAQVDEIGREVMSICRRHPEGVHLVGFSQGGLIARAIIETFDEHNIKTFISLAAPQAGLFGVRYLSALSQPLNIASFFDSTSNAKSMNIRFYSRYGQKTSVGAYWNDPYHQDEYFEYSTFLPLINNEIRTENSTRFRENLINIDQMVLIGGPDDDVIMPWQSSQFGFYKDEDTEVIPYNRRKIYRNDAIGLRTLKDEGRLEVLTYRNVKHSSFITNKQVIEDGIIQFLD